MTTQGMLLQCGTAYSRLVSRCCLGPDDEPAVAAAGGAIKFAARLL
jgi:hypothetical protein